jgi:hypothetical protein
MKQMLKLFTINRKLIITISLVGLFLHMFLFSSEFVLTKLFFLITTFLSLTKKSIIIIFENLIIYTLFMLFSLVAFINGFMENNMNGVVDEFKTYIFWPTIIYIIFSVRYARDEYILAAKIFEQFIIFIPPLMIVFLALYLLGYGDYLQVNSDVAFVGVGINEGSISLNIININFLIFGSFFIILKLFYNKINLFYCERKYVIIALISYLIIFLISGRKGWYLSMGIILLIAFLFNYKNVNKMQVFYIILFFIFFSLSVFIIADIDWNVVWGKFIASFDPKYGGEERFEQFNAMVSAIQDKPTLGYGFGSSVESSVRNLDKPWHYELTYLKLILNMGIPIASFFILTYSYMLIKMYLMIPNYRFIVLSIFGYIIIAGTNPYLSNFDAMWILFVPLLYLNLAKINVITIK